jgi:hypothetical protein
LLCAAACDVEWGGTSVALIDPAPVPEPSDTTATAVVEAPLPVGPLLYALRSTGSRTVYRVTPVARLIGDSLAPLGLPDDLSRDYRARFDSTFLARGSELVLQSGGRRIGSAVIGGTTAVGDVMCPSVASARVLVLPGETPPTSVFGVPSGLVLQAPGPLVVPQIDDRIRTFGPILAEELLRSEGETRPFLAQRASLTAVAYPGDQRPAMAATYLINDQLGEPPPAEEAVSLFYVARFEPASGYVPVWSEVRRYGDGRGRREVFTWADAILVPEGRVDLVHRHGETGSVLAASPDEGLEGQRRIVWVEGERCASERLLGAVGGGS